MTLRLIEIQQHYNVLEHVISNRLERTVALYSSRRIHNWIRAITCY